MHPILFRIPMPHMPLKLWWALAAVAAIALFYVALSLKKADKQTAGVAGVVAIAAGAAGYYFREKAFELPYLPIYSYGAMLGLSLVVGWYLTLTLAERDGLPKEVMANCYVFTAFAAIAGARLLYVATNLEEFKTATDVFALGKGGFVAYGGFLGGFFGSWGYLSRFKIRLLPWADVAVPSLASGLLITRIGCYLFGCDFGKRLPDSAPAFLKTIGTFPHWASGTVAHGDGAPAYLRHLDVFRGTELGATVVRNNASLPVHPTQVYESLVGLALLGLLLWQRKSLKFRGQVFLVFTFAYGTLRFLLEIIRDDAERGEYGPMMGEHLLVPGALLLLAVGFAFGLALAIRNPQLRTAARVGAFVVPVVAYVLLKPATFGQSMAVQLSTSQWIGLLTALLASYFYAVLWQQARKNPVVAMSLGEGALAADEQAAKEAAEKADADEDDDEEDADGDGGDADDEEAENAPEPPSAMPELPKAPPKVRSKGLVAKGKK